MPDIGAILEQHLGPIAASHKTLAAQLAAEETYRERVRTIKPMRFATAVATPGPLFTFTAPAQGYAWEVKMFSGTLSANDSVAAYIGDGADGVTTRLVGYAPPPGTAPAQLKFVINVKSSACVLSPGEKTFLQTSGTGNLVAVMVVAVEIAGPRVGVITS